MTDPDRDVEHLLRRYRPVDPRPELRARVMNVHTARTWPWLAAAAALLLLWLGVRRATDAMTIAATAHLQQESATTIARLADALGGDPAAWQTATLVVHVDRERRAEAVAGSAVDGMPEREMP